MTEPQLEPRLVGDLFALSDDARFASMPDGAVALEAHIRASGDADLVVGYTNKELESLVSWVGDSIGEHRQRWRAFYAAVSSRVIDAGAQIGSGRFQTYLRGRFGVEAIEEAFNAADVPVEPIIARNSMLLFGRDHCEMIGLELGGSETGGAIYLAVPNNGAEALEQLTGSIAFLLDAQLPGTESSALWKRSSRLLLESAVDEWIYISMPPLAKPPWVKIDVGARPLVRAELVAREVGADVSAMLTRAREYQLDPVAHIGVRFGNKSPRVSIYGNLGPS